MMIPMPPSPVLFEYPGGPTPIDRDRLERVPDAGCENPPAFRVVEPEHPTLAHHCHAEGCPTEVPPEMLMCRRHWFMVPAGIRNRVWSSYRAGQCDDRRPSGTWWVAAEEAVCHVALQERRITPEKANERIAHAHDFAKTLEARDAR